MRSFRLKVFLVPISSQVGLISTGVYEFVPVQSMEKAERVIVEIVRLVGRGR